MQNVLSPILPETRKPQLVLSAFTFRSLVFAQLYNCTIIMSVHTPHVSCLVDGTRIVVDANQIVGWLDGWHGWHDPSWFCLSVFPASWLWWSWPGLALSLCVAPRPRARQSGATSHAHYTPHNVSWKISTKYQKIETKYIKNISHILVICIYKISVEQRRTTHSTSHTLLLMNITIVRPWNIFFSHSNEYLKN